MEKGLDDRVREHPLLRSAAAMAATGAFQMVFPSRDERVFPGNDSEEKSWTNCGCEFDLSL